MIPIIRHDGDALAVLFAGLWSDVALPD